MLDHSLEPDCVRHPTARRRQRRRGRHRARLRRGLAGGLDKERLRRRLATVYLSALAAAGQAPPSIGRAQAAIAYIHARAGHLPPHRAEGGLVIAEALAGIRRSRPTPPDRKAPADAEFLSALLGSIAGDGLAAVRDRALLALGMALAAQRSELVALELRDLD